MNNTTTTAATDAAEALLAFATDIAFVHCLSVVATGTNVAQLTTLRFAGAAMKLKELGVPQDVALRAVTAGVAAFRSMQRDLAADADFLASLG
jgi:hypothetical protein